MISIEVFGGNNMMLFIIAVSYTHLDVYKRQPKKFKKISFLRSDVALTKYLNPKSLKESIDGEYMPIFPFGCNNSQYVAVKRAMENQISVIQGPPGTGKDVYKRQSKNRN